MVVQGQSLGERDSLIWATQKRLGRKLGLSLTHSDPVGSSGILLVKVYLEWKAGSLRICEGDIPDEIGRVQGGMALDFCFLCEMGTLYLLRRVGRRD